MPTQHILLKPPCHAQLSRIQESMAPGTVSRGRILAPSLSPTFWSFVSSLLTWYMFIHIHRLIGTEGDEWRMERALGTQEGEVPTGLPASWGHRLLPMGNQNLSSSHSLHPHCLHPHHLSPSDVARGKGNKS